MSKDVCSFYYQPRIKPGRAMCIQFQLHKETPVATKKKAAPKKTAPEELVTMTIEVRPKQVTVITTFNGKNVPHTMNKTESGCWEGVEKADKTMKKFEALFPDCDLSEIEDIISELSSRGMDMHRELLFGEDG